MDVSYKVTHVFTCFMRRIGPLSMLLILGLPVIALAHSNEYLATVKGGHGGMLRMAEKYHFELLVKAGEARVWVTDHGDTAQSTLGATGNLRLIASNGVIALKMIPAGGNELVAKDARIKPIAGTKIMLNVSMKGESPLQVRYALGGGKEGGLGKH